MIDRLLSEAAVNAIADLGASGSVQYDEDVLPAFTAAGFFNISFFWAAQTGADHIPVRDRITMSLLSLKLEDPQVMEGILRFARRIAAVYMASNDADRVKILRLRNAFADDGFDLNMEDGNMSGFSIDKRGIAQMMREMQQEFDKHSISVPVNANPMVVPPSSTTIYNGPVIHGDANGAQLAWGNENVNQTQHAQTEQVAPGFEAIAQAVAKTLEGLHAVGLADDDRQDAEAVANEALSEVTQAQPDRGKLRRALVALKGFLAPIAAGLMNGSAEGAQEWARTALDQLGTPF